MRRFFLTACQGFAIVLLPAILMVSCSKTAVAPITNYPPPVKVVDTTKQPTYTLVWSDEFNGTAVDTTIWNFEKGSLGVNQEEEYYQASNATVANGNLVITAKQQFVGSFSYTSARMNTLNKYSVTYGRIEARIKLPLGQGLWPAFWMMGSNINTVSWPNCGETDIMEHIDADNTIYGTIHWNSGGGAAQYGLTTTITNPDDYHIYAIEWDTNSIRWYVDSTLYCTANIANGINNTQAFQKPFFILLNLAVGGDFPGLTVDQSKLPASMYVDYVRVYSAK